MLELAPQLNAAGASVVTTRFYLSVVVATVMSTNGTLDSIDASDIRDSSFDGVEGAEGL